MQINLELFKPAPNRRRTVLLFVFRDRVRGPHKDAPHAADRDVGGGPAADMGQHHQAARLRGL